MKRLALTLLLLAHAGCADVRVRTWFYDVHAVTLWKDPKLDHLKVNPLQLTVQDYMSASRLTGADVATIGVAVAKLIVGIP